MSFLTRKESAAYLIMIDEIKNIILVGFMGSGKTAVGQALARSLGWEYIDSDDVIEDKENRLISVIFDEDGEEYFRQAEEEVLEQICSSAKQVIAAGGGAMTRPKNQEIFKDNGRTVYLYTDAEVIWQRVKDHGHRPLLNVKDPQAKITELLNKRESFYNKADLKVDTSRLTIDEVVVEIRKKICVK
ncbi:MAG: shikimate kinase [Candidatus Omnitrophica bacterium]|nr:shikimate kinase [Candidatus Omnitrophota bacterium]